MQRAMPRVERAQPGQVGVGVALEQAPVRRVGGGKAGARSRAPRPRRCAGRATSAGRSATPRRRSTRPAAARARVAPRSTTSGVAAAVGDDLVDPVVELVAVGEDELRARRRRRRRWAAARTRAGRCSAAGSGRPRPRRRRPRGRSRRSGSSSRPPRAGRRRRRSRRRSRRASRASAARAAAARAGARGARASARAAATRAKTAPATTAIVAPGGASVLTESQSPTRALERRPGRRWRAARLRIRRAKRRAVTAGTTKSAATSSAPTTESAAVVASAIRPSRATSRARGAGPERRRPRRGRSRPPASGGRPAALASSGRAGRDRGEGDVAAVDQQQAAEEQGLDVGAGAEDVAGEDHAGGEAADEDDRDDAVASLLVAAGRAAESPALKTTRGAEGAERRREAEPVGEHQPGEGRGADRVREEGEPAQDDPGAEQPGRDGEDQDLDQAALDEGQLEGLEHRPRLNQNEIHFYFLRLDAHQVGYLHLTVMRSCRADRARGDRRRPESARPAGQPGRRRRRGRAGGADRARDAGPARRAARRHRRDADRLADKVRALRIFDDAEGRMNEPLGEREVLCVSQFTLYGDARKGNRPSYVDAAPGRRGRAALRPLLRAPRRRQGRLRRLHGRGPRQRRPGHTAAAS